jgi:adenylate cyclase
LDFQTFVNTGGELSSRWKIGAIIIAVSLVIILGTLDYLTGREWAISPFYLLPTVNVASRIEALNKMMGTTLLFGKATRDALKRPVSLRSVPRQTVEGVEEPLELFTVDHAWA